MKPLGERDEVNYSKTDGEREFVCWVTGRKLQAVWHLRQILGLVLPQDQRLSGFIWKLCDVFCSRRNAGYQRVPVDTTVKCLMHVKGNRRTRDSPQLMLQSSPSFTLFCVIFECESLSSNNTAYNTGNNIDYSLHRLVRLSLPWIITSVRLSDSCSAALTSWHLVTGH